MQQRKNRGTQHATCRCAAYKASNLLTQHCCFATTIGYNTNKQTKEGAQGEVESKGGSKSNESSSAAHHGEQQLLPSEVFYA
jgi:hypothetical protein